MESNVLCFSSFKEAINERREVIEESEGIGSQGEALAIEYDTKPHILSVVAKEKIFDKIPSYRFVISEGEWDAEFEGDEPFNFEVRVKGTDISAYGKTLDSAWIRMSAVLVEEEMI